MSDKRENAINAIKKRQGGKSPQRSTETNAQSGINFYSGEVSSLKVQPKSVLVISLVYLGVVVLLHIFSKLRGGSPVADAPPV